MSGKGKPPKGPTGEGKTTKPFRVVRQGEPASAKPSPDQIKQIYMASPHIEWTPFARSMGWSSLDSRGGLPIEDWIRAKHEILAREQAETIAEAVFVHRGRWHQDVLKTLKEYPEANDAMLGILKKRLNDIIGIINDDERGRVMAAQTGGLENFVGRFQMIKNNELLGLAAAIKVCTESKHKALMIHDWSFKVAETFSDPKQFATATEREKDSEWKVEIIGGENLSHHQMQDFLGRWYDKPALPHKPDEIEASAHVVGGEGGS